MGAAASSDKFRTTFREDTLIRKLFSVLVNVYPSCPAVVAIVCLIVGSLPDSISCAHSGQEPGKPIDGAALLRSPFRSFLGQCDMIVSNTRLGMEHKLGRGFSRSSSIRLTNEQYDAIWTKHTSASRGSGDHANFEQWLHILQAICKHRYSQVAAQTSPSSSHVIFLLL